MTGVEIESFESATWSSSRPDVSVVVATHNRAGLLPGLLNAMAAQETGESVFELVVVDDGSTDDTATVLRQLAESVALPLLVVRIEATGGPSVPRNVGAARARAPYVLFTDDDCLPTPGWATALQRALSSGNDVVQGRTIPEPGERPGPWARAIWVEAPGPLFETCNVGFRKTAFDAAGGFPLLDLVQTRNAPRGFGEDAALGCAVARSGRRGWASDALVHHRWLPGSFADHLTERRRLVAFPGLAREVPEVAERLTAGVFLSKRTLRFDLAVAGVAAAALSGRPWPALAALPWVHQTLDHGRRIGAATPSGLARLALADAVGLSALVRGSVRTRRPVL